jgi:hypothetical protein
MKPDSQRRARTFEDRARRHRRTVRARRALPSAVPQQPPTNTPTLIADETVRPAQPPQVIPTVLISAEPCQHLPDRPRIVSPALKRCHEPNLLRLSGDS